MLLARRKKKRARTFHPLFLNCALASTESRAKHCLPRLESGLIVIFCCLLLFYHSPFSHSSAEGKQKCWDLSVRVLTRRKPQQTLTQPETPRAKFSLAPCRRNMSDIYSDDHGVLNLESVWTNQGFGKQRVFSVTCWHSPRGWHALVVQASQGPSTACLSIIVIIPTLLLCLGLVVKDLWSSSSRSDLQARQNLEDNRWAGQSPPHSGGGAGVHTVTRQCDQAQREGRVVE